MKKLFFTLFTALCFSSAFSQKISDTLIIKMDTTTFKNIIGIIQNQIDSKQASKYILDALQRYEFIFDKPKEIKK